MKKALAEDMVRFVRPIRERAEAIYNDHDYLKKVMEEGAEKARRSARHTIEAARGHIGLKYDR
jgi:tryptophanyl-tRNA synthetase